MLVRIKMDGTNRYLNDGLQWGFFKLKLSLMCGYDENTFSPNPV